MRLMIRLLILFLFGTFSAAVQAEPPHWQPRQVQRLLEWLDAAADDGLGPAAARASTVRDAMRQADSAKLDAAATEAAVHLVQAHRIGCCYSAPPPGWNIGNGLSALDPAKAVETALAEDRLDLLFGTTRPSHPYYYSLRRAYAAEKDPARRSILAANLDRWRWMPRQLGERYLIVNTASFEATLWENGRQAGRWEIIVGKMGSPTPVFAATVTGVIFNPWWEIPASIVEESIGALMRNHPDDAATKGYVMQDGRYRQRPGPTNALGRMKLVMPNSYNVYLHDTPSQSLFARDRRTFSHGCVRVGDALGLAATLLSASPQWDRARVDATVAKGDTVTVPLAKPIPVYITYFTAEPDGLGGVRYFDDVYKRDGVIMDIKKNERCSE
jgi:murein L,D-transpeptidase YcbB/YkuD